MKKFAIVAFFLMTLASSHLISAQAVGASYHSLEIEMHTIKAELKTIKGYARFLGKTFETISSTRSGPSALTPADYALLKKVYGKWVEKLNKAVLTYEKINRLVQDEELAILQGYSEEQIGALKSWLTDPDSCLNQYYSMYESNNIKKIENWLDYYEFKDSLA